MLLPHSGSGVVVMTIVGSSVVDVVPSSVLVSAPVGLGPVVVSVLPVVEASPSPPSEPPQAAASHAVVARAMERASGRGQGPNDRIDA